MLCAYFRRIRRHIQYEVATGSCVEAYFQYGKQILRKSFSRGSSYRQCFSSNEQEHEQLVTTISGVFDSGSVREALFDLGYLHQFRSSNAPILCRKQLQQIQFKFTLSRKTIITKQQCSQVFVLWTKNVGFATIHDREFDSAPQCVNYKVAIVNSSETESTAICASSRKTQPSPIPYTCGKKDCFFKLSQEAGSPAKIDQDASTRSTFHWSMTAIWLYGDHIFTWINASSAY
ncbi:hypothetical protein TESG_04391 [Trichophyton tonsurans CBS 112818]|uniref:Uncharacterized protein n=1 Tax=Trichophyton tonsurans (strain CBS 112818) TaxID=647933 RepID=F2S068_TRIT1|nr:hypothetical protein TESG_04391 [Trichophyton tonsurans CBS 112818]